MIDVDMEWKNSNDLKRKLATSFQQLHLNLELLDCPIVVKVSSII
jgi:hypothetical protein